MAYKEWIRLGRDPVFPHEFRALSGLQAKQFLSRIVGATAERIDQLKEFMNERRPTHVWRPDCSKDAFVVLGAVFLESIETVSRSAASMNAERDALWDSQPEIMNILGDNVREWEPTDRTASIMFDAGLYFAQDLMSKEIRLRWHVDTAKSSADFQQPILRAPHPTRKPPFLSGSPIDVYMTAMFRVKDVRAHRPVPWPDIYDAWMGEIALYQAAYPPDSSGRDGEPKNVEA